MFTDDHDYFYKAIGFRTAAMQDKWETKPATSYEDTQISSTHEKEGFKLHITTRRHENPAATKYFVDISCWGPDRLCITPPEFYDWETIKAGVRTCNRCRKTDVDTFQYSFAGRACKDCLEGAKKEREFPGWTL